MCSLISTRYVVAKAEGDLAAACAFAGNLWRQCFLALLMIAFFKRVPGTL